MVVESRSETFQRGVLSTDEIYMIVITVLGTGCSSRKATVKLIEDVALAKGADVTVEKVSAPRSRGGMA